jgi:hypothetical protein
MQLQIGVFDMYDVPSNYKWPSNKPQYDVATKEATTQFWYDQINYSQQTMDFCDDAVDALANVMEYIGRYKWNYDLIDQETTAPEFKDQKRKDLRYDCHAKIMGYLEQVFKDKIESMAEKNL